MEKLYIKIKDKETGKWWYGFGNAEGDIFGSWQTDYPDVEEDEATWYDPSCGYDRDYVDCRFDEKYHTKIVFFA